MELSTVVALVVVVVAQPGRGGASSLRIYTAWIVSERKAVEIPICLGVGRPADGTAVVAGARAR